MKTYAIAVALMTLVTVQLCAEEWPQFGGKDGNFKVASSINLQTTTPTPTVRWQHELGKGLSSVVCSKDAVYATYLKPFSADEADKPEAERVHREVVVGFDRDTGQILWQYEYEAGWLDQQEAFGGRIRCPQATPVLHDNSLVAIGFTGILHCLEQKTGKLQWRVDMAKQFDAPPVQFGFSASPIVLNGRLIVLAGGKKGGLVCLDFNSGDLLWNVPCKEASYATPVVFSVGDAQQIVFITTSDVIAVEPENGTELWRYALPKPEMTNVPTPLMIDQGTLVISGQGIGGTRELKLEQQNGQWNVKEGWFSRVEFFYCNWIFSQGLILGCDGDLLVAIDATDGKTVGRWRGYADSNLVEAADNLFILDGKGVLATARREPTNLNVLTRHQILSTRCWAPPTVASNCVFCRDDDQVVCVQLIGGADGSTKLEPLSIIRPQLDFKGHSRESIAASPVDRIVAAFEQDGTDGAARVYTLIRNEEGPSLSLEHRRELADMAIAEGLQEFAGKIMSDALQDFPKVAETKRWHLEFLKDLTRSPSTETKKNENGLVYLELGIRNNTFKTVQALVKGPSQHAFSYGIPIAPGQVRVQKWPVGTQLYETVSDHQEQLLLTVQLGDAGRTVNLKDDKGSIR